MQPKSKCLTEFYSSMNLSKYQYRHIILAIFTANHSTYAL